MMTAAALAGEPAQRELSPPAPELEPCLEQALEGHRFPRLSQGAQTFRITPSKP